MKIELATHSGFCMGVRNAILRIVKEINHARKDIHVYGPLIHNPQTVEVLHNRGLKTIYELDNIDGREIAIRTHGIPVEEYREIRKRSSRMINLTCPRVARVQGVIKKYSGRGFFTIIIGDSDHAEVIGLKSYAASGVHIISDENDIETLPVKDKYVLVSQTTLDRQLFDRIVEKLHKDFDNIHVIDTICDSTRYRQDDVIEGIRKGIDTLVVVGGKNSANTNRLAGIGRENDIKTLLVETEDELNESDFDNSDYILVTAGASTPGWIINNVLEKLYNIKFKKSNLLLNFIKNLFEFIVRTNLLSAVSAFYFTLIVQFLSGGQKDYINGVIAFLYIFSMYSINNYFDRSFLKYSNTYKYKVYKNYGLPLVFISILFVGLSLYLSLPYGILTTSILVASYVFGFIYSTKPVKKVIKKIDTGFITKIYDSKVITSIGWLIVTVLMPLIHIETGIITIVFCALLVFSYVFIRHFLIDIILLQGDLILGKETLPTWIGIEKISTVAVFLGISALAGFTLTTVLSGKPLFMVFFFNIAYFLILLFKIKNLDCLISVKYELLVDLNYILLIAIWYLMQFIP